MHRNSPRPFTPEEEKYLKDNYLTMPLNRIANHLGRYRTVLREKLKRMGLVIPPETLIKFKKEFGGFKEGHTPFNKGKKIHEYLDESQIKNMKYFKKGHVHNAKPVGTISTHRRKDDGRYVVKIKVGHNKWELLHVHNWKFVNGAIPKGYSLACKDGNTQNCDPANWELITKKEGRNRNSAPVMLRDKYIAYTISGRNEELKEEILKYPELIEIKRQSILLNRQINNCAK